MVEVSASARQGDSGGPIFNARGELAGVLFGSGGGTTSGSYAGRVGQFLATAWPPPDAIAPSTIATREPATSEADQPALAANVGAELHELPPKKPLIPLPNQPPPTQTASTAGQPTAAAPAASQKVAHQTAPFTWEAIAGRTTWDQFKTILAAIGVVAIFLKLTGRQRSE
jgi:hypothetical protein